MMWSGRPKVMAEAGGVEGVVLLQNSFSGLWGALWKAESKSKPVLHGLTYCQLMGSTKSRWRSPAVLVCISVPRPETENLRYKVSLCSASRGALKPYTTPQPLQLTCEMLEGWWLCGLMLQKWSLSVLSSFSLPLFSRPRFFKLCRESWITLTVWALQRWRRKYSSWDKTCREQTTMLMVMTMFQIPSGPGDQY